MFCFVVITNLPSDELKHLFADVLCLLVNAYGCISPHISYLITRSIIRHISENSRFGCVEGKNEQSITALAGDPGRLFIRVKSPRTTS